jgi:hypothetical protein
MFCNDFCRNLTNYTQQLKQERSVTLFECQERRDVSLGNNHNVYRPKRTCVVIRKYVVGLADDLDYRATAQDLIAIKVFRHCQGILRIFADRKQQNVLFFGTSGDFVSVSAQQLALPIGVPMKMRILLLLTLILFCSAPAMAQRPGPEFWRRVGCEPLEPRTRLEALEDRHSTVVFKGFTRITTVEIRGIRIDAIEIRELGNVARAKGIVFSLREGGERPREDRAFIDYEEIEPLLNAIDVISQADETVTKLAGFEAKYRTVGDLQITVFKQTRRGNAVILTTGVCEQTTGTLSLDELAKVRAMLQEAKMRLDELR